MQVEIRQEAAGFTGELHVRAAAGPSAVRRVQDSSCSEVVEGLAVVAAIALGAPAADDVPTKEPPTKEPPTDTPPRDEPPVTPARAAPAPAAPTPDPAPAPAREPRLRGSSFEIEESVEVGEGTLRFDREQRYTLSAGAAFGLLPFVRPRFDFEITLASFVTPPSEQSYLVGPVWRVRMSSFGEGESELDGFSLHANYGASGGIGVCAAITYDSQGFIMLFCSEVELGLLQLRTKSLDGTYTQFRSLGFGTGGLGLSGQYNFSTRFHLDLHGGGQILVGDISTQRPDGSDLFEAGTFGAYVLGGVGLHF